MEADDAEHRYRPKCKAKADYYKAGRMPQTSVMALNAVRKCCHMQLRHLGRVPSDTKVRKSLLTRQSHLSYISKDSCYLQVLHLWDGP